MSGLICPHCEADNYKLKDPSDLPWVDGEDREMPCSACDKTFWVATYTTVKWNTYPTEEEYEYR